MPLNNINVNKWARKLTIIFQLAIWSIVGIVLVQKGAISLYEKMKPRDHTIDAQEKFTKWNENESESNRGSNVRENYLKIAQLQAGRSEDKNYRSHSSSEDVPWKEEGKEEGGEHPRKGRLRSSPTTASVIGGGIFQIILNPTMEKRTAKDEQDDRDVRSIQSPTVYASDKNEIEKIKEKNNLIITVTSNENPYDSENSTINNSTSRVSFDFGDSVTTNFIPLNKDNFFEHENGEISYKSLEKNKNEQKSRRSPVNRVGAAVAIIMLAIGVVMLLLGPLIVIVRAFSSRRRTREMFKSRCYNDQPPTYEEATLMDQAPRYSTLQLHTILDPPLSP